MSGAGQGSKTAAELQIENLKRLKALQKGIAPSRAQPAAPKVPPRNPEMDVIAPQNPVQAPSRTGMAVTEIIDLGPDKAPQNTPQRRPAKAKPRGTRIVVDTALYKRLKAKWRLERRFPSEREYWFWALQTLLSGPVDSSEPKT
jgi:hypothetical protein